MKEELYNRIEDYINGQLIGLDLKDFKKLMQDDAEFAKEVDFHRALHKSMEDPIKRKLRDSLDLMRDEFKETKAEEDKLVAIGAGRQQKIWWMAAASLILLATTWWFLLRTPTISNDMVDDPKVENKKDEIDSQLEEEESGGSPVPEGEVIVEQGSSNDDLPDDEPKPNTEPLLVDPVAPSMDYFVSNSELASVITNIKEQKTHQFEIQIPASNESISASKGIVALYFKGELISFDYPESDKFSLTIFDNQADSYQNNKPVFQTEIAFAKAETPLAYGGAEDYTFLVDEAVKMKAGRYYYLVRLVDETLAGGSFVVKDQ